MVAAGAVLQTVVAWRVVKSTHDIKAAHMCCCKNTQRLFGALDELEKEIISIVKETR